MKKLSLYELDDAMELVVETTNTEGDVLEIVTYKVSDEGQISVIDNTEHLEDEKQIFESRIYSAMENVVVLSTTADRNPTQEEKKELYAIVEAKVNKSEK